MIQEGAAAGFNGSLENSCSGGYSEESVCFYRRRDVDCLLDETCHWMVVDAAIKGCLWRESEAMESFIPLVCGFFVR
jgi:hypothetical protein